MLFVRFNVLKPSWTSAVFELFFPFRFRFTLAPYDSLCTGPVANQSLPFCLAVMHTYSQQHILISPEFKAHQSQLTGPPCPPRAILKKCFILSVRHHLDLSWWLCILFLLPSQCLCSGCNDFSDSGCHGSCKNFDQNEAKFWYNLKIKQPLW